MLTLHHPRTSSWNKAFKDYSWASDVPNTTMMVPSFKTIPIVYGHRNKLRFCLQPYLDNRANGDDGYNNIKDSYHIQ